MTRRTPGTVTIEIARTSNNRLKIVRDSKATRLDRQVTVREALDDVLDWWDATADMRNMGIDGDALKRPSEQEVKRP